MTWTELAQQPYTQKRNNLKEIKKNAKELMIHVVSSMCDNRYILSLRKNSNGEFRCQVTDMLLVTSVSNHLSMK